MASRALPVALALLLHGFVVFIAAAEDEEAQKFSNIFRNPSLGPECGLEPVDVVFLLDSSGSVTAPHFQNERELVARFVNGSIVGPKSLQVSVVTYSSQTTPVFPLNQHHSRQGLLAAIKKIPYDAGLTYTGNALEYIASQAFSAAKGGRPGVRKILVVVTDGSSIDYSKVVAQSKRIHQSNVDVFAVGVGNYVNRKELETIASKNSSVLMVANFSALSSIQATLKTTVCTTTQPTPSPHTVPPSPTPVSVGCGTSPADIVFLLDASGSVFAQNFQKEREFVSHFVNQSVIGPKNIQIGAVTFSSATHPIFTLHAHQTKADLLRAIQKIPYPGGLTYTGKALEYIDKNSFTKANGARPGVKKVLIVVTDGASTVPANTIAQAKAIHKQNIDIYAIGVGNKVNKKELETIATNPNNVFMVTDFNALKAIQQKVMKVVCASPTPPPTTIPVPTTAPAVGCGTSPADIVFLLDASGSVFAQNFQKEREFVSHFVNQSVIGPKNIQIGAVTFSSATHPIFTLHAHQTKADLLRAIQKIPYPGGLTYTGKALEYIDKNSFTKANGARPGVKKVLIVVTDGASTVPANTIAQAKAIHKQNIDIYAIGVGNKVNKKELETIATNPNNVFMVTDFNALKAIQKKVMKVVCASPTPPPTTIPVPTTAPAVGCGTSPADIVFLLDASGSVFAQNFQKEREFVSHFVNQSVIGPKNIQIGAVTFSSATHPIFTLHAHQTKADLLRAIQKIPYPGGLTYTGKALEYIDKNSFTKANGARPGVKKVLIVVTDGASTVPANTIAQAKAIHKQNIDIYAIGVGNKVNKKELETIATNPNNVFMVTDFNALKAIQQKVMKVVCASPTPPACAEVPTDVMFLLDSSGSVQIGHFKEELKFVNSFVNANQIGPQAVRLGLVTFSTNVQQQFGLDNYTTKASLTSAINKVAYTGGLTYTGRALEHIQRTSFRRARAGARKILVVVTDGQSTDPQKTIAAARAMHLQNVEIYAIGVGGKVNQKELRTIATDDKNVFMVTDFKALRTIQSLVQHRICGTSPPEECGVRPADILFVLDSSGSVTLPHFKEELVFVNRLINHTMIGMHSLQVGLVTFSTHVHPQFTLDRHLNKTELMRAVLSVPYTVGMTYTDEALRYAREHGFTLANGARPGVPKIVVVITDGQSTNPNATLNEIRLIHKENVEIISVGVGSQVNRMELEKISTDLRNVFMVRNFSDLRTIQIQLSKSLCQTPAPKTVCGISPADIVFLLDRSGSIVDKDFATQLSFVARFANESTVGSRNAQISVVTFATNVQNEFWLNTHRNRTNLVKSILGIVRQAGSTNTGEGLKFVRETSFLKSHGGRDGVPHVVVVITDGQSTLPSITLQQAALLHQTNITVIAIGVGTNVNQQELKSIATDDKHVFNVVDYSTLGTIKSQLFHVACGKA